MWRFKIGAIVSLISLMSPLALASPEQTPFGRIVVRDTSDRYETRTPDPWMIPMTLLGRPRDQWSQEEKDLVSTELYGKFLDVVEGTRDHGLSGHCNAADAISSSAPSMVHPPEARYSISQITGDQKTVIVGEVVRMETAWDFIATQVATLVHVKVTRVVRAMDPIVVGDLITIRRPWGSATVRGVTLCSSSKFQPLETGRQAQEVPERMRQQLLLVGHRAAGNRFFFNTGGFGEFQIIEGFVHYPQNFSFYRENKPENLASVIQSILGGTEQ